MVDKFLKDIRDYTASASDSMSPDAIILFGVSPLSTGFSLFQLKWSHFFLYIYLFFNWGSCVFGGAPGSTGRLETHPGGDGSVSNTVIFVVDVLILMPRVLVLLLGVEMLMLY